MAPKAVLERQWALQGSISLTGIVRVLRHELLCGLISSLDDEALQIYQFKMGIYANSIE